MILRKTQTRSRKARTLDKQEGGKGSLANNECESRVGNGCECVAGKKRIMWINLQNLQPMVLITDSTESTESHETSEYRQAKVDRCTKHIVDAILDNPHISVPEILRQLAAGGQQSSEASVIHLFGGPQIFRKTCHRMEILRWVLVTHQWEWLPFQMDIPYREWEGKRRYHRKPDSNDDWVSWWAPDMCSVQPFEPMEQTEEEEDEDEEIVGLQRLYRFPAEEDESEYFADGTEESESQDSDIRMMEEEGNRA